MIHIYILFESWLLSCLLASIYFCTMIWISLLKNCWIFCRINSIDCFAVSHSVWCIELRPLYRRRSSFHICSLNSLFGNFYAWIRKMNFEYNFSFFRMWFYKISLLSHLLQYQLVVQSVDFDSNSLNVSPIAKNYWSLQIYAGGRNFQSIDLYSLPCLQSSTVFRIFAWKFQNENLS